MLADLLEEVAPQLVTRVAAALPAAATERVDAKRTIARLPELMRGLVEHLRVATLDALPTTAQPGLAREVAPLVTALGLLKREVYAAIEARQLPATPREMRIVGDWFGGLAEAALSAENRLFADMLDALPDHVILHGAGGEIIYLNRAAAAAATAVTGLSPREVLGRTAFDLVGNSALARHFDELLRRVRDGESVTDELILPGPDGGRWHEQHMRALRGPDGTVEAVAIASRDIQARKQAEARLQLLSKLGTLAESMEYERVLAAVARMSIPELADWCIIDIVEDGTVRRGTVAHRDPEKAELAEELLRFPPQLHGLPLGKHVLAGGSSLVAEIDAASDGTDPAFGEIVRRLGGQTAMIIPFVVMGTPVAVATFVMTPESKRRHGPDDLALAEEMVRRTGQIIENARLHQELRRSETRFRVALEHSNITVFEEDTDFNIRWMYNAPQGFSDGQFIGNTAKALFSDDVYAELAAVKQRVLATGEGARVAVNTVVNGQRRHVLISYEPLRSGGGIVGITGAGVDVTELKKVEEELARELGFRERMMGILGHDLRNPVSAVLGLAGLLRLDAGLSDKAREGLQLIASSARRMNEMITTLLDFTQLRFRGALPIAAADVDLGELAQGLVAELRAAHRGRAIELSIGGDVRGRCDPGRIAQLVSNLVANAHTHGAGEAPVSIALAGDGDRIVLRVSNHGPAIPAELVERLFEPFQQGIDAAGQRGRGLGLGLFIVREIVRAHAGTIDVRSGDDVTTFTVALPRSAALPPKPAIIGP